MTHKTLISKEHFDRKIKIWSLIVPLIVAFITSGTAITIVFVPTMYQRKVREDIGQTKKMGASIKPIESEISPMPHKVSGPQAPKELIPGQDRLVINSPPSTFLTQAPQSETETVTETDAASQIARLNQKINALEQCIIRLLNTVTQLEQGVKRSPDSHMIKEPILDLESLIDEIDPPWLTPTGTPPPTTHATLGYLYTDNFIEPMEIETPPWQLHLIYPLLVLTVVLPLLIFFMSRKIMRQHYEIQKP